MTVEGEARAIVEVQTNDEGLWFVANTAPEAYLQQELRRLHRAIEANVPVSGDADAGAAYVDIKPHRIKCPA